MKTRQSKSTGHAGGWVAAFLIAAGCAIAPLVAEELKTAPPTSAVTPDAPPASLDEAVQRARADLRQRTGAPDESIRTVSALSLLWLDSGLGCGSPTEQYASVEVEGFQVILEHDGKRFDYRSRKDGNPTLCEPGIRK